MSDYITLAHGSGGSLTRTLIRTVFLRHLQNPELEKEDDATVLAVNSDLIAFTTDNFIENPVFFKGGDLGKLAVCGTVNDLSVTGADPKYLSAGYIIEEGYPIKELELLVKSMAASAFECGVKVVSMDVKVLEKNVGGRVYINTSGIGVLKKPLNKQIQAGDDIIVSGTLGEHELTILLARNKIEIKEEIQSDCAPLNSLTRSLMEKTEGIRVMKDPSRGGLITALYKLMQLKAFGVILQENMIPVKDEVRNICNKMGIDPLYLANQGKLILICDSDSSEKIISVMHSHPLGRKAAVIGKVTDGFTDKVCLAKNTGEEVILSLKTGSDLNKSC